MANENGGRIFSRGSNSTYERRVSQVYGNELSRYLQDSDYEDDDSPKDSDDFGPFQNTHVPTFREPNFPVYRSNQSFQANTRTWNIANDNEDTHNGSDGILFIIGLLTIALTILFIMKIKKENKESGIAVDDPYNKMKYDYIYE